MLVKELIKQTEVYMTGAPSKIGRPCSLDVFQQGGEWMRVWLDRWDKNRPDANRAAIDFNTYGFIKYLLCIGAMGISAYGLYYFHPYLLPLCILVFYVVEVHFLFLFPLLIDGVEHPLWQSILITHRIGLFRVLAKVIPIACFMLAGLLKLSDPLRNWHKGCLAILIWYQQDVRNRI